MGIVKEERIGNQRLILGVTACDGGAHVLRGSSLADFQAGCLLCPRCDDGRFHRATTSAQGVHPLARGVLFDPFGRRALLTSMSHSHLRHATFRFGIPDDRGQSGPALCRAGSRSFAPVRALGNGTVLGVPSRSRIGKARGGHPGRSRGETRHDLKRLSGHSGDQSGQGSNTSDHWMRCA